MSFKQTEVCGTPGYIAPEANLIENSNLQGDKIDIYSVGVVLFNMLTK